MPLDLVIPCEDCALRSESLRLKHFTVLGCNPISTRPGSCLLRYEDPFLKEDAAPLAGTVPVLAVANKSPTVASAPSPAPLPAHEPDLDASAAPTVTATTPEVSAGGALPVLFAGKARPLSTDPFGQTLAQLQVPAEALWSVIKVETSGCGYLPDRRPKILYERHVFSHRTKGRFDAEAPGISNPDSGGYAGGAAEYYRLGLAMALDRQAALESASWGLGQVMGFNAASAGFRDVEDLIACTCESEDQQLSAMTNFIQSNNLAGAMRKKDWTSVAKGYNGKRYKQYDKKLGQWYAYFQANGVPDIRVRQAQIALLLLGHAVEGSVDGVYGKHTADALKAFQHAERIAVDGQLTSETMARLRQRAGWD